MRLFFAGRRESPLYAGTVDEDKKRARQVLRESNSEARTLSDILAQLPNIELQDEKKRVHFGLVDASELQRCGVDVLGVNGGTKCHVLAIFDGVDTPPQVRVLAPEFIDRVDQAIVGNEKFATRAYQISPEDRIRTILTILK